jgi:hypothetical protein
MTKKIAGEKVISGSSNMRRTSSEDINVLDVTHECVGEG